MKTTLALLISLHCLLINLRLFGANQGMLNIGSLYEYDVTGDGTIDYFQISTNSYDNRGDLIKTVLFHYSGEGILRQTDTTIYEYDKRGSLLLSVQEISGFQNLRIVTTYTNLAHNQTQEFRAVDFDGDGTIDDTSTTTTTLDPAGDPLLSVTESDSPFHPYRIVLSWIYDYQHRQFFLNISGSTGDSAPNFLSRVTFDVDEQRRRISFLEEVDDDADGEVDVVNTGNYSYDKSGNLIYFTGSDAAFVSDLGAPDLWAFTYSYAHRGEVIRASHRGGAAAQ